MAIYKIGSTGQEVRNIQAALKITVTGTFDTATANAVKAFQTKMGFTGKNVDGIVGPMTMAKLIPAATAPAPAATGNRKLDEKSLERIKTIHPNLRDELNKIFVEASAAVSGRAILRLAYTLRTFA